MLGKAESWDQQKYLTSWSAFSIKPVDIFSEIQASPSYILKMFWFFFFFREDSSKDLYTGFESEKEKQSWIFILIWCRHLTLIFSPSDACFK